MLWTLYLKLLSRYRRPAVEFKNGEDDAGEHEEDEDCQDENPGRAQQFLWLLLYLHPFQGVAGFQFGVFFIISYLFFRKYIGGIPKTLPYLENDGFFSE